MDALIGNLPRCRLVGLLVAIAFASLPLSAAYAGSDGQEIGITLSHCGGGLTGATSVEGHNQRGAFVTWHGGTNRNDTYLGPGPISFTQGWWWRGKVTVRYHQRIRSAIRALTVHTYVPRAAPATAWWPEQPNFVHVDCNGTSRYGSAEMQTSTGYNADACSNEAENNPSGYYVVDTVWHGWYGTNANGALIGRAVIGDNTGAYAPLYVTSSSTSAPQCETPPGAR